MWRVEADLFLQKVFQKLAADDWELSAYALDHICFRTVSAADYAETKAQFASEAQLLTETKIHGRPIATYQLNLPIPFDDRQIWLVEVPAPKDGQHYPRGFEHVEFVTGCDLATFQHRFPKKMFRGNVHATGLNPELTVSLGDGVAVKFHPRPLDEVIRLEKSIDSNKSPELS